MKKKIFFVLSTNGYSGAEAVNISIIENLKEEFEFFWVSRNGEIVDILKEKNIKWIEIKELSLKEIKRVCKEYKPEVVHATDYKASVICSLIKKNFKLISHLHNNSPWLKKYSLYSFIFLLASLRFNKILTVSKSIESEYVFSKFIKNKIINVGNPVSREKILSQVNNNDYKKRYDICCIARVTKQKNPFKFIQIIKTIKHEKPDIKVLWIGAYGELKEECIKLCKKYDIFNNIDFLGFQKNPYKLLASSKIFVLTSDWEGYGLVAFEALTLGIPCVVSKVGGLVDIVDDTCGKLCNINKIEDYDIILEILNDNCLYQNLSKGAIEKSKKLDNIGKYIEIIRNLYNT